MTLYFRHGRRVLQLSEAHFQCPVYLKKGRFFGTLINNNSNNTPKMVAPNHKFSTMLYPSQMLKRHVHMNMTMFESVTVDCPPFAESITEGDVRWEKEVGDAVEMDETVAEVETDKTGIPIQSPLAGTVEELLVEDGTTVQPGTPLFKISTDGAVAAATPKKESSPETPPVASTESATPPPATPPPTESLTPPPATPPPAVLEQVPIPQSLPPIPSIPTQPLVSVPTTKPKKIIEMPQPGVVDTAFSERSEHRSKMNRMRLRISQRLKDSQNTAAMLTTFNEVDMSNIMAFRSKYKDAFHKKHGIKLSFMSGFIKAAAYALKEQPVVNAVIDDAAKEIVYRDYVDISVAVATPKGLVVPVLRNCEGMNFLQVEKEMNELAAKARNNHLTVEDMDGGTFTISNGGVFGSMFGTPIINPPQSAILGMHAIFDRPVAIKGEVKIRPMMYIALTYDHRLIDGREAVTFLKKIKEGVEDPLIFEIGM